MKHKTTAQKLVSVLKQNPVLIGFVADALHKHTDLIMNNKDAVREQMKTSGINPDWWIACAQQIRDEVLNND